MRLPVAVAAISASTAGPIFSISTSSIRGEPLWTGLIIRKSQLTVSDDARCGGSQTCLGSKYGDSCSQFGWCGSDSSYSGPGCQPDFGTCDSSSSLNSSSPPPNVSTVSTTTLTLYTTVTEGATPVSPPTFSPTTFSYSANPTSTLSNPAPSSPTSSSGTYIKVFLGDGSQASGWPPMDQWLGFDTLWTTNLAPVISQSCAQFHVPNNSPQESDNLKAAINSIAESHNVDPRFALAIALQESNGCVRVPTTDGYVPNPGLFQSFNGTGTCNSGGDGTVPCPDSEIQQMVKDGVTGTGPGSMSLMDAVRQAGESGSIQYYRAARIYNSGSIASSGLLQDGVATHCYATDVANRLLGWNTGPTRCKLNG